MINLSRQLKKRMRNPKWHDVTKISQWKTDCDRLQLSLPVPFCHRDASCALSTRFRYPQIIVRISRTRACLFNWVKIGSASLMQANIFRNRQLRFYTRETGWCSVLFPYWKIPCMLSRSDAGDVALWFATLRFATSLYPRRITVSQLETLSPREFCDVRLSFLQFDIQKIRASEYL